MTKESPIAHRALAILFAAVILIPLVYAAVFLAAVDYQVFHEMHPTADVFDWLWSLGRVSGQWSVVSCPGWLARLVKF